MAKRPVSVISDVLPKSPATVAPTVAKTLAVKKAAAPKPVATKPAAAKPTAAKPVASISTKTKPITSDLSPVKAESASAVIAPAPAMPAPTFKSRVAAPVVDVAALTEPSLQEPAAPAPKAEQLFVPETAPKMTAAPVAAPTPSTKGLMTMNDTVNHMQETAHKIAADATAHVETFVAGATEKAKEAAEKTKAMAEDAVTFHKDNAEAVAASGKLLVEGVQSSAQYAAELGRKHFEEASATLKAIAAAKTPSEFFSLQSDYMKSNYEAFIAESSKSSEATMKFFGEVFQPISSRFAVAAEKVKSATAA